MGGAPVTETLRPGVTFQPAAMSSFIRAEVAWGRRIDVNSTYRDYDTQLRMYNAWNCYVAGRCQHPGHSRAMHPDLSFHCKALALDSDDWRTPGFIAHMARHGWIRTAANDPTEQHHFEYQASKDQYFGQGRPAGVGAGTEIPRTPQEEDDMFTEDDRRALITARDKAESAQAGIWNGGTNIDEGEFQSFTYGVLPIVAYSQAFTAAQLAGLTAAVSQLAGGQVIDYARIEKAAATGAEKAVKEWAQNPKA